MVSWICAAGGRWAGAGAAIEGRGRLLQVGDGPRTGSPGPGAGAPPKAQLDALHQRAGRPFGARPALPRAGNAGFVAA
jgi:hypothetical protein